MSGVRVVGVAVVGLALKWGDFNARYRVFTSERNFAPAALDLDLMAWLVDEAPHLALTWELQRGLVLCRGQGIAPPEFRDLIGAAVGFASRIRKAAPTYAPSITASMSSRDLGIDPDIRRAATLPLGVHHFHRPLAEFLA